MRPVQKSNRTRGRGNRKPNGNSATRVYDSSGPDGKVRGTPQQIIEKYLTLARDAQTSGDRVAAENFLQHAEHYQRILILANVGQPENRSYSDEDGDDDAQPYETDRGDRQGDRHGERHGGGAQGQPYQNQPQQPQPAHVQPQRDPGATPQPHVDGQPSVRQPSMHQPSMHQPSMHQPSMHQPSMHQPLVNETAEDLPAADQASGGQPTESQSGAGQTGAGDRNRRRPQQRRDDTPVAAPAAEPMTAPAVEPAPVAHEPAVSGMTTIDTGDGDGDTLLVQVSEAPSAPAAPRRRRPGRPRASAAATDAPAADAPAQKPAQADQPSEA